MAVNWNPQRMQQVSFNPNQGLAVANSAFKNVSDTVDNHQEAQSLAAYRNANLKMADRKQDFAEGAMDRQRAEKERLAAIERNKMITADRFAEGARLMGVSKREQDVEALLSKSPEWKSMSPEQRNEAKTNYLVGSNAQGAGTDPKIFKETVKDLMMESDLNYTPEEVDTYTDKLLSNNYPTMDKETFKLMMQYGPGKEKGTNVTVNSDGSVSRGNSSGSVKSVIPQVSVAGRSEIASRIAENRGLEKSPDTVLWTDKRYDVGDLNPTYTDIEKAVTYLSSKGITSPGAIETAINGAFGVDGKTLPKDMDFTTKKGRENLLSLAKENQKAERQLMTKSGKLLSGSGSDSEAIAENNRYAMMDKLLSATAPKQLSDEELAQNYLQSAFGDDATLAEDTPVKTAGIPEPQAETEEPVLPIQPDPNSTDPILANMADGPSAVNSQPNTRETKKPSGDKLFPIVDVPEKETAINGRSITSNSAEISNAKKQNKINSLANAITSGKNPPVDEIVSILETPGNGMGIFSDERRSILLDYVRKNRDK